MEPRGSDLDDLGSALKESPVGVFFDKNRNILYVVGAALAIGGAVALYVTKTGGPAIDFPMIVTARTIGFRRVPSQVGQGTSRI